MDFKEEASRSVRAVRMMTQDEAELFMVATLSCAYTQGERNILQQQISEIKERMVTK